jgi:hypothetical protein
MAGGQVGCVPRLGRVAKGRGGRRLDLRCGAVRCGAVRCGVGSARARKRVSRLGRQSLPTDAKVSMEAYNSHAALLERAVSDLAVVGRPLGTSLAPKSTTSIDALRQLVPKADRDRDGVFFTPSSLANELWALNPRPLNAASKILDPAAGAGALLRPVLRDLSALPASNLDQITVGDLHDSFVRTARAQLSVDWSGLRSGVLGQPKSYVADYLAMTPDETYSHIILNPPFSMRSASSEYAWANGRVNIASEFVVKAISELKPSGVLLAILPDVLRSGTRYRAWRDFIASRGRILAVRPYGQFSAEADVDIFLFVFTRDQGESEWPTYPRAGRSLNSIAEVRVGTVVPHRDPLLGPVVPFLTARNLTGNLERRYEGRLFEAPFLAINRTTRPRDRPRLKVNLVDRPGSFAVENHLLIVKLSHTHSERLARLRDLLSSDEVSTYLDNVTGCRHMTVSALKDLRIEGFD